jgi:peptide/nickel transport system permease protein
VDRRLARHQHTDFFVLGILLGTVTAYFPRNRLANIAGGVLVTLYPVPYFILSLVLVMAFAYYIPLFPLVGGATGLPANLGPFLLSILRHAFLPALSLVLLGTAFRFIIALNMVALAVLPGLLDWAWPSKRYRSRRRPSPGWAR